MLAQAKAGVYAILNNFVPRQCGFCGQDWHNGPVKSTA